ncbi:MAG: DUF6232 family protein [Myxococcales bacterium]|nr:DUF6232 family protein [Polyangiaceae bacterium]MDW8250643.1 DUF6232 family protein [Myxococcales bacterium]
MSERILLQQPEVTITDREARFPGGTIPLKHLRRSWIITRRPGLAVGAVLAFLGGTLVLRGVGLFRLVGAVLVGYGVLRARAERHTLMLQLDGATSPWIALETRDISVVQQVLTALAQAKMSGEREDYGRLGNE